MEQSAILEMLRAVLKPYLTNKNTGNVYEIATILWIGKRMGLTKESADALSPLLSQIAAYNNKATAKINAAVAAFKALTLKAAPFSINGSPVTDLQNVTQDDSVGSGDLIAICADGSSHSISICDAYGSTAGDLRKCLKNPTCKAFGCGDADITAFKATATAARAAYKTEMTARFGSDVAAWKRKTSTAAVAACSDVATRVAATFNDLSPNERRERARTLLHSKLMKKPADYLAMVRPDWTPVFYKWETTTAAGPVPETVEPTLRAAGIYLYLHLQPESPPIAQIQVKFNNGINSAIHSSWNAVVHLERVFTLAACSL